MKKFLKNHFYLVLWQIFFNNPHLFVWRSLEKYPNKSKFIIIMQVLWKILLRCPSLSDHWSFDKLSLKIHNYVSADLGKNPSKVICLQSAIFLEHPCSFDRRSFGNYPLKTPSRIHANCLQILLKKSFKNSHLFANISFWK